MHTHTFKVFSYPLISWMCVERCRGFWEWNINRSGGILWSPSSERPLAHGNDLILITANKKDKLSFCSPQGPRYQLSHHAVSLSLFLPSVCVWDFSRSGKWGEKIYRRRVLERRVRIRLFSLSFPPVPQAYRKSYVGSCARVHVGLCREEASLRAIKRDWCLSGELDLHDPLLYLPLFALISLAHTLTHTHCSCHWLNDRSPQALWISFNSETHRVQSSVREFDTRYSSMVTFTFKINMFSEIGTQLDSTLWLIPILEVVKDRSWHN